MTSVRGAPTIGRVVQVTDTGMTVQVAWRGFPRSWHASYSLELHATSNGGTHD